MHSISRKKKQNSKLAFNITIPFTRQVVMTQGKMDRTLHW